MSLKFNEATTIVAEKLLETPKPKYQTYKLDAAEISAKMDQELIKINSIFKGIVTNWDETADFYKTEVTKLQIPLLRLKMPFTVEPQHALVFSRDKVPPVNLKTSVNHPAVENGYLNGEKLTKLFIWDLNRVIDRISKITCISGKIYKLGFEAGTNSYGGIVMVIEAMENDSQDFSSISYGFLISFIFTNKPLYYYIYDSNVFHQVTYSSAVSDYKKDAIVKQKAKILLQTLVNQSSKLSPLFLLMVFYPLKVDSGIGDLLLKGINILVRSLQRSEGVISYKGLYS